jgi:hypothetical protein
MVENLVYGGAYAYGKTAAAMEYVEKSPGVKIRRKVRADWLCLKPGTHEGYVSWERFEAIHTMVSNNNVPTSRHHGAPKHGDALLAGLIRRRGCGRKLTLRYIRVRTMRFFSRASVVGADQTVSRFAPMRANAVGSNARAGEVASCAEILLNGAQQIGIDLVAGRGFAAAAGARNQRLDPAITSRAN